MHNNFLPLTLSSLGRGVATASTPLLLDVVRFPPATHTERVRLILSLTKTGRTLRLGRPEDITEKWRL